MGSEAIELENRINKMKLYYLKGFVNYLTVITTCIELSLIRPGHYDEKILRSLKFITGFYDTIPFAELKADRDFRVLFRIRVLLKEFERKIHLFLKRPSKELAKQIQARGQEMADLGREYQDIFNNYLKRLRRFPGYRDFRVVLVDAEGNEFSYPR